MRGRGKVFSILAVGCILAWWTGNQLSVGAEEVPPEDAVPLTARQLLDAVVDRLPQEPLNITGSLIVRRRRGVIDRELTFDMFLHWGASPPEARYVIRDAFGQELEALTVVQGPGEPHFQYRRGSDVREPTPDELYARIQRTDLSWTDLTLSFLWWPDGAVTGTESVRGRSCYVVEVPAPSHYGGRYRKVRMWIDANLYMLLQAEGYDETGDAIRRLWVRSFKKINDRWMIKEMEIQAEPAYHRTKLRIEAVNAAEPLQSGG